MCVVATGQKGYLGFHVWVVFHKIQPLLGRVNLPLVVPHEGSEKFQHLLLIVVVPFLGGHLVLVLQGEGVHFGAVCQLCTLEGRSSGSEEGKVE